MATQEQPEEEPQEQEEAASEQKYEASPQRRVAEAITLALSVLIVGGLALYLALQARLPTAGAEFVTVRAQVKWEQAQRKGGRTILPIEIENASRTTLRQVLLLVTFQEDGKEQEREVAFDYVAAGARRTAYMLFKREVSTLRREAKLEAEPSFYTLD